METLGITSRFSCTRCIAIYTGADPTQGNGSQRFSGRRVPQLRHFLSTYCAQDNVRHSGVTGVPSRAPSLRAWGGIGNRAFFLGFSGIQQRTVSWKTRDLHSICRCSFHSACDSDHAVGPLRIQAQGRPSSQMEKAL